MTTTLELGPIQVCVEKRRGLTVLRVTGRPQHIGPVKLQEDFDEFMKLQDGLLDRGEKFCSIYDFRNYPFFPPVSLIQQVLPWVVERKPQFDKCVVTVAVCLRENFWTSAAKAIVYTFAKAAPPEFPWTIATNGEDMESWVDRFAAEYAAACKAKGCGKPAPGSPVPSLREAMFASEDRCAESTTIDGLSSLCSSPPSHCSSPRSESSYASACSFADALSDFDDWPEEPLDCQQPQQKESEADSKACRECCGAGETCVVL